MPSPHEEMADRLIERVKRAGYHPQSLLRAALARRLREMVSETRDPHEVEYITTQIALRDRDNFSTGYSLQWGTYEYIRSALNLPDGSYEYRLWAERNPGRSADSAHYWLDRWSDLRDNEDEVKLCRAMLGKLVTANLVEVGF